MILLNTNWPWYYSRASYQSPIDLFASLNKVSQWSSRENTPLLEANFKEGSTAGIIKSKNYIIIDKRAQVGENPVIANKAIELAVGHGKGSVLDSTLRESTREEREIKGFEDLEELVLEQWESFSFTSQDTALKQAREYKHKNPQVAADFTRKVLSKLYTAGAVEAWDILHWYMSGDTREANIQLAEIDQLSKNIDLLLGDRKLAEIFKANRTPIVSMFEAYKANIPRHLENAVDGSSRNNQKRLHNNSPIVMYRDWSTMEFHEL